MDKVNIKSQLKKGLLEFCVLTVIADKETYASELIQTLKDVDLIIAEGTVYPLMSRLRKEELVDYKWVESDSGPPRKYYILTDLGKQKLDLLRESWESINNSIKNF